MSLPTWDGQDSSVGVVMISALEHYSYCPRQCGLIYLEQTFDDNVFTVRGHHAHERADEGGHDRADNIRIERGLPVWSNRLGLVGKADVVEFHGSTPYPVEYKVGRRRQWVHETLQLCAQALCLEEMFGVPVPRGAIYYRTSRRRREVLLEAVLRKQVEEAVGKIRAMLGQADLPAPVNDARCPHCSLIETCMPGIVDDRRRLRRIHRLLFRPDG